MKACYWCAIGKGNLPSTPLSAPLRPLCKKRVTACMPHQGGPLLHLTTNSRIFHPLPNHLFSPAPGGGDNARVRHPSSSPIPLFLPPLTLPLPRVSMTHAAPLVIHCLFTDNSGVINDLVVAAPN